MSKKCDWPSFEEGRLSVVKFFSWKFHEKIVGSAWLWIFVSNLDIEWYDLNTSTYDPSISRKNVGEKVFSQIQCSSIYILRCRLRIVTVKFASMLSKIVTIHILTLLGSISAWSSKYYMTEFFRLNLSDHNIIKSI